MGNDLIDRLERVAREEKAASLPSRQFGDDRTQDKLAVFYNFAECLGQLSRCRRLQVGTVVATSNLTEVVSIGYNGPPAGLPNDGCRAAEGTCGCVHSEANALVKLKTDDGNLVLLCTMSPCEHCAGLIVNSGRVRYVVYGMDYRDRTGLELLKSAGVVAVRWR